MADVAVENNDVLVGEKKEVEEIDSLKKIEKEKKTENGTDEKVSTENGGTENVEDEDDDDDEDEEEEDSNAGKDGEINGSSTEAQEAVKRKIEDKPEKKVEDSATPEKKAKLDDSKEVETTNGAGETEVAA